MFRPLSATHPAERRGVILLVVMALLTLFSLVGIGFYFYSTFKADNSRVFREAMIQANLVPNDAPETLFDNFLRQLIYDVADDTPGSDSALRGYSLARTMYGWDDGTTNTLAYNGTGHLHFNSPFSSDNNAPAAAKDDFYLINFTWFQTDGFVRDPERLGPRADPTNLNARQPYTGGYNPSYTYPDLKDLYLAAMKSDGTVLMPSYHRPWLFNPNNQFNDQNNPNWSNKYGKYFLIRPRPADMGPGFPYPADATGDIKNLVGTPGGNDSIWLSINSAVEMLPDGRKYQAMYAPLILDLDNRINLNVVGNVRGWAGGNQNQPAHVSNQGWGPWETNVGTVVNGAGNNQAVNEWTNLFLGYTSNGVTGRYGSDGQPSQANQQAQGGVLPKFYSQVDYDGCNEQAGYVATNAITLPAAPPPAGNNPYTDFPTYPQGYGNGSAAERTNHPMLSNYWQPAGDDRVFDIVNMRALLRDTSTTLEVTSSDLGRLCPVNFTNPQIRRLVTTLSFDVDRAGVTPFIWDPNAAPYTLGAGAAAPNSLAPNGAPINFQALSNRGTQNPPSSSDYAADWRAVNAAINRIDLNRPLTNYPAPDNTGRISDLATFNQAQQDRQTLAADIFIRLVKATGAFDLTSTSGTVPSQAQYDALRWLAQLSVNIVDYIDTDDYMTPFNWVTSVGSQQFQGAVAGQITTLDPTGKGYVFGTELPHLVLNEAYAELDNDPTDPLTNGKATKPYVVNFWVELYNPMNNDSNLMENGYARLQMPALGGQPSYPAYQVVMAKSPNNIRQASNVLGDPDQGNTLMQEWDYAPANPPTVDTTVVQPSNGATSGPTGSNVGYYVLGPKMDFPGTTNMSTLQTQDTAAANGLPASGMDYTLNPGNPVGAVPNSLPMHTLLLRRLACPYLPPNPGLDGNPVQNMPLNPYITVDYMDNIQANDGVKDDNNGTHNNTPVGQRASSGRVQPYAADPSNVVKQNSSPPAGQPIHTFFAINQPIKPGAFDWLTHLDRPLISPMELLQVSGYKPHELTQQFMVQNGTPFGHRVPWFDEDIAGGSASHRLYRLFEFLETNPRATGISDIDIGHRRIPGKININTVWDFATFQALCDAQAGNSNAFDAQCVQNLWNNLMAQRTPTVTGGNNVPGSTDRPFWGFAVPNCPAGDPQFTIYDTNNNPNNIQFGINSTILCPTPLGSPPSSYRLFGGTLTGGNPPKANPPSHPYLQDELLTKIASSVTTRSHVFVLWLTVGFFQVTNDTSYPVQLGQEIGASTGQNVRHHMFAIVDRSALTVPNNNNGTLSQAAVTITGVNTIKVGALQDSANPPQWWIKPGTILTVDNAGSSQETLVVTATNTANNTITAKFNKTHATGVPIMIPDPGNPGPQPQFLPQDNSAVVPYYAVID